MPKKGRNILFGPGAIIKRRYLSKFLYSSPDHIGLLHGDQSTSRPVSNSSLLVYLNAYFLFTNESIFLAENRLLYLSSAVNTFKAKNKDWNQGIQSMWWGAANRRNVYANKINNFIVDSFEKLSLESSSTTFLLALAMAEAALLQRKHYD